LGIPLQPGGDLGLRSAICIHCEEGMEARRYGNFCNSALAGALAEGRICLLAIAGAVGVASLSRSDK
jgi:hypothetical protein